MSRNFVKGNPSKSKRQPEKEKPTHHKSYKPTYDCWANMNGNCRRPRRNDYDDSYYYDNYYYEEPFQDLYYPPYYEPYRLPIPPGRWIRPGLPPCPPYQHPQLYPCNDQYIYYQNHW